MSFFLSALFFHFIIYDPSFSYKTYQIISQASLSYKNRSRILKLKLLVTNTWLNWSDKAAVNFFHKLRIWINYRAFIYHEYFSTSEIVADLQSKSIGAQNLKHVSGRKAAFQAKSFWFWKLNPLPWAAVHSGQICFKGVFTIQMKTSIQVHLNKNGIPYFFDHSLF